MDCAALVRMGQPHHSTTGAESINSSQGPRPGGIKPPGMAPPIDDIEIRKRGTVNARLAQKRLVMPLSSESSSSSSVNVSGSRAMPHLGHIPGPICLTSRSIGQV